MEINEYKTWTYKAKFEDGWSLQGYCSQPQLNITEPDSVTIQDTIDFIMHKGGGKRIIKLNVKEVC